MSDNFFNLEKKPEKNGNFLFIVVPVILLVVIFGLVIISQYAGDGFIAGSSEKMEEERDKIFSFFEGDEEEQNEESGEPEELEEDQEDESEEGEEESSFSSSAVASYTETAEEGEGLTHLARKATTSYMEDEGVHLTDEQRVYVEDYVQKELQKEKGTDFVDLGEDVEISSDLIEEGAEYSSNLTDEQLNNLSQYASLVSF